MKILLVSQMYPGPEAPDYGVFVRDLADGDLVVAQVGGPSGRYGPHRGKLLEVVGREDEPRAASLIAIHAHGIPTGFSQAAEDEAEAAQPPALAGREDLRGQEACVRRAPLADRHGGDRHAFRHLHDRQQRVHAPERRRRDRHADHR